MEKNTNQLKMLDYKLIADNAFDMVSWISSTGKLSYISPSCEKITGYKPEEHYQNPRLLIEITHPSDRALFEQQLYECYQGKSSELGLARIITKGGELKWIGMAVQQVFDETGRSLGFRTSTRDMTRFREMENQLEKSKELYSSVVEVQIDIIFRLNSELLVTFVNKATEDFLGIPREKIIGKKFKEFIRQKDLLEAVRVLRELTVEKPITKLIYEFIKSDGTFIFFDLVVLGIFGKEGTLVEVQVIGRDITESREAKLQLEKALEEISNLKEELEKENLYLREKYQPVENQDGIITESPLMFEVLKKVQQVADTDSPVLITGETGTGKELLAHAIHNGSKRKRKLMIVVNCAALPSSLIESELFGREKGAYTGAMSRQIGRFQMADESTIFLDEVGEIPLETQVKLLRVLQFNEFQMLGSPVTRKVNVRIIAATNMDLQKAVEKGTFRADLYYRLNVFPISVPPLRDRKNDIPILVWSFVDELSARIGRQIDKISPSSMADLKRYSWPGNIRELKNIIEYSLILNHSRILEIQVPASRGESYPESLDESQRAHIENILGQTGWRIRGAGGAAEKLGMKESTLRYRMKKLGIERRRQ